MTVRPFLSLPLLALAAVTHAAPGDYRFVSVYSGFGIGGGAINNNGTIVVALDPAGPSGQIVSRVDWPLWTEIWQADFGSNEGFSSMDINDANQIAGVNNLCCVGNSDLIRLEEDGTPTTLANEFFECDPGEFCGFGKVALNNSGLVAAGASFDFGAGSVPGVWLFGNANPVEIARQGAEPGDLMNFTAPSLNSASVVAFGATEIDGPFGSAYTGTGGPVTFEGMPPYPQGGNIGQALINDSHVIGVVGNGVHVIDSGIVTTVLAAQFGISGPSPLSLNNNGGLAFLGCVGTVCGIFTGSDPVSDAVLRAGDALFDGTVTGGTGSFGFGADNLNDNGEITFNVSISVDAVIESHLVFAIPLSPAYDRDEDGVANDVDNCLTVKNALQRDTDSDGFGNFCDTDLNNDGTVNSIDLGLFRSVFFSTDLDADFNGDGVVNPIDLGIIKLRFFNPPGPSALVE